MASSGIKLKTLPAITVTTAGTRVPLYSQPLLVYSVTLTSINDNQGSQVFGDESVTISNGAQIFPGDVVEIEPPDRTMATDQFYVNEIYVDSDSNGAEFRVVVWIRD